MLVLRTMKAYNLLLGVLIASLTFISFSGADNQSMATHTLKTGWAQQDITPLEPVILTGQQYARVSEGVRDPLTATVLAIESLRPGGEPGQLVFVSCDLLSVSECIRDGVRAHLATELPELRPEAIILSATHTHTAPYHYGRGRYGGGVDPLPYGIELPVMSGPEYVEFAARRIADGIIEAWNSRSTAGIAFGLGHAVLGRNRIITNHNGRSRMYGSTNNPNFSHVEGYEDHSVNLLATFDTDDNLTGLLINIACPTQAQGSGWHVSADFWHEARIELRQRFGENVFILPQVSAAGDQDSRPPVERDAEARMMRLANRDQRQELAVRIADAVERTLPLIKAEINWNPVFAHYSENLELPRRIIPEEDVKPAVEESKALIERYEQLLAEIEANPELRQSPRWYRDVTRAYRQSRRGQAVSRRFALQQDEPNLAVEVHIVRLGDIAFATNPFELYLDYGIQIKGRSPATQTFVVQLAGPGSYLPTVRSIAGGAYGAVPASTDIGADGGKILVDWSVERIAEMWQQ